MANHELEDKITQQGYLIGVDNINSVTSARCMKDKQYTGIDSLHNFRNSEFNNYDTILFTRNCASSYLGREDSSKNNLKQKEREAILTKIKSALNDGVSLIFECNNSRIFSEFIQKIYNDTLMIKYNTGDEEHGSLLERLKSYSYWGS